MWWQSRVKCVLKTWDFGYAHSLVGGPSSWGSQKPVGSPLAFQGRQQETLSFCSVYFPFLSSPLVTAVSPQRQHLVPAAAHTWPSRPPFISFILCPPLPEKLCCLPAGLATTFSAITTSATAGFAATSFALPPPP